MVVEDSHTGSRAGLAAGCRVLGVPNGQVLPSTPGLAVADSLLGVGVAHLAALPHPAAV